MVNLAQSFFAHALAPSTHRTYRSAQRRYTDFCGTSSLSPIPVTQSILCLYVSSLAAQGVAHKSIKGYLSAIRHLQVDTDTGISEMVTLSYILTGIKRTQAASGSNAQRQRLPITAPIMRELKRAWESMGINFNRLMLWAACCACFHGFLRSGEATVPTRSAYDPAVHLSMADVSVSPGAEPQFVVLRIKTSKTDPFRQGVDVCLGRTDNALCPVAALLAYVSRRGTNPGPLFVFDDGSPLTREALVREVRGALAMAGIDAAQYSGHSFRSGAATTAAAAGVEDSVIKILGRWQSSAYQVYVKLPRESLAMVSRRLADQ